MIFYYQKELISIHRIQSLMQFRFDCWDFHIRVKYKSGSCKGCQDDDGGSYHLYCLLAPLSHLLHYSKHISRDKFQPVYTGNFISEADINVYQLKNFEGNLPSNLLAGNVQLNVQSNDLLLYESKVNWTKRFMNSYKLPLQLYSSFYQESNFQKILF